MRTFHKRGIVLLHFDQHFDTILWFWAVLLAGGLPVLSPPFSNVEEHRGQHILALSDLLQSPICLTTSKLLPQFGEGHGIELWTIEQLLEQKIQNLFVEDWTDPHEDTNSGDLAVLMMTSGSTGNAKAVQLTHQQVLAAVAGKAGHRALPSDRPFLNWIGLDHVAGLVEIHIQALYLGVDQVHVSAADIVSSPTTFLELLSRHSVCRSFAPNFFLAKLVSEAKDILGQDISNGVQGGTAMSESVQHHAEKSNNWDLSSLAFLASGGEANDVQTCVAAASLLKRYGAPDNVIATGFGMTETCAGCIYNLDCPSYDLENDYPVASLGTCIQGVEMRVESPDTSSRADSTTPGNLQVRGPVVFQGYYRNPSATDEAFTPDGWFRTGDQAMIDSRGNLVLMGRTKDILNINSVKFATDDVQRALEQAVASQVAQIIVFPSRAAHTEQVTVALIARNISTDMADIQQKVIEACMLSTASRPLVFSLQEQSLRLLPVSTLGKISRAKMRALFEAGKFEEDVRLHNEAVANARKLWDEGEQRAITQDEQLLINDFAETLGTLPACFTVDTSFFDLGFTSMHLIKLKHRIDIRLGQPVPVIKVIKNPTARLLAAALSPTANYSKANSISETISVPYDPVVTFRTAGSKTPLWLVHPGVGEVLVFVGLAHHMSDDDRPLYALRTRGFDAGQEVFTSIPEAVDMYLATIRTRQPKGPYALAGYSYGTMLAFEIAKKLEALDGPGTVQFLGSFNLPPHIKTRMRQLSWNMCLLNLAYFLELTTEEYAETIDEVAYRAKGRQEALDQILSAADLERLQELGYDAEALLRWADVAYGLQHMAVDYEPSGQVEGIDVFHAIPLKSAAKTRDEWMQRHVGKWADFTRTPPRFHEVGGAHYTMIGPDHVLGFSETLKQALRDRGL
jgi:acyl-CoA synthetase (AMP-forming)/AMP-acid ligase II/thioesterase domain-containing protein